VSLERGLAECGNVGEDYVASLNTLKKWAKIHKEASVICMPMETREMRDLVFQVFFDLRISSVYLFTFLLGNPRDSFHQGLQDSEALPRLPY
jgi:hypothetical protein